MKELIIYGANGFTGQLISRLAKSQGVKPVLAGRNLESIKALSEELKLPHLVFSPDSADLGPELERASILLNCAGPFTRTAPELMKACLKAKIHYLDITGEIAVFEMAHSLGEMARASGVVLMPGVGFDVVPTDCLANALKEEMPDATHLELAFHSGAGPSKGTVKTMIENIPLGGKERVNGTLINTPLFHRTKVIPFRSGPRSCAAIPWGDLATAYFSTGIPNIIVYSSHPPGFISLAKLVNPIRSVFANKLLQDVLKSLAHQFVKGPSLDEQLHRRVEVWGRVSGPHGSKEKTLVVPEGYRFTSEAALECVRQTLKLNPTGYKTPAQAFGHRFIEQFFDSKQ